MTVTETIVEEQLVRSRHRVKTYGEVFTPRHMVDRMLDLVREELETGPDFVDKTFLEPAAGAGRGAHIGHGPGRPLHQGLRRRHL